jgi:hypothetical protein
MVEEGIPATTGDNYNIGTPDDVPVRIPGNRFGLYDGTNKHKIDIKDVNVYVPFPVD